jgi:hypothetical protein
MERSRVLSHHLWKEAEHRLFSKTALIEHAEGLDDVARRPDHIRRRRGRGSYWQACCSCS